MNVKYINVCKYNVKEIFKEINSLCKNTCLISLDTEFPGIVLKIKSFKYSSENASYHMLRKNVNVLKTIQIGLTFDKNCNFKFSTTFQFNFVYDFENNCFAQDSIDLLSKSKLMFETNNKIGINLDLFKAFLTSSSLLCNKKLKWITFHSGYDFGYLVNLITNKQLPLSKKDFIELLNFYFPCFFDLKHLGYFSSNFYGSLDKIAEKFKINRIGKSHQAGSDSLITLNIYKIISNDIKPREYFKKFKCVLYNSPSVMHNYYI